MINKKLLATVAVGILTLGVAVSAWAAPGKFSIQADELDYDMKSGQALAKGNVVIIQENGKATANNADYNTKTKSGSLMGNVIAERGDERITCDEFKIVNDNDCSAIGNATLTKGSRTLQAPRLDYSKSRQFAETFGNWAKLSDSDGSVLTAVKIVYDEKAGLATATGGVNVNSPARKLTAYGDKAIYDTKKDGFVELIGNAIATQDGNTVKGDKLRLTNANVAVGDGNVQITYIPEQKTSDTKAVANTGIKEIAVTNKESKVEA